MFKFANSFLGLFVTGIVLGIGATSAQAATLTLDNFETVSPEDPMTLNLNGNRNQTAFKTNTSIGATTSILGGEREVKFERTFNATTATRSRTGSLTIDSLAEGATTGDLGTLTISNGSGFSSKSTLVYDGIGKAGLNANLSPFERFDLQVENIDLAAAFNLTISDLQNNRQTVSRTNLSAPGILSFQFAEFATINFSNVKSVVLEIVTPNDVDVELNSISVEATEKVVTPEPSTLLGMALVAGVGTLLAKKKSKI
jgi:hypothetical protein